MFARLQLVWVVLLGLVLQSRVGSGMVVDGVLDILHSWSFVSRFCFLPVTEEAELNKAGYPKLDFTVRFPPHSKPFLLLYYNGFDDWKMVYDTQKTATRRHEAASERIKLYDETSRHVHSVRPDYKRLQVVTRGSVVITNLDIAQWMFVAFANVDCEPDDGCAVSGGYACTCSCEVPPFCQGPLDLEYSLTFTNGRPWNHKHFSGDEVGILQTDIVCFVVQGVFSLIALQIRLELQNRQKCHPSVNLLVATVTMQWAVAFLSLIHYSVYSQDGVGARWLLGFSAAFRIASEACLILLLMLLAKGLTLVRRKISGSGRVKIACFISMYLGVNVVLELWKAYGYDHAEDAYVYQSPPGVVMVMLDVYALIWFWYACYTTYKQYGIIGTASVKFYYFFVVAFTWWLWASPLLVAFSESIPETQRAVFMFCWERLLMLWAHAVLLWLYHPLIPARFNFFPFHQVSAEQMGTTTTRITAAGKRPGLTNLSPISAGVAAARAQIRGEHLRRRQRQGGKDVSRGAAEDGEANSKNNYDGEEEYKGSEGPEVEDEREVVMMARMGVQQRRFYGRLGQGRGEGVFEQIARAGEAIPQLLDGLKPIVAELLAVLEDFDEGSDGEEEGIEFANAHEMTEIQELAEGEVGHISFEDSFEEDEKREDLGAGTDTHFRETGGSSVGDRHSLLAASPLDLSRDDSLSNVSAESSSFGSLSLAAKSKLGIRSDDHLIPRTPFQRQSPNADVL